MQFHDKLRELMNQYVHYVYRLTKKFPKEEIYGVTSQLRRSSLSIILNYIEGYSRKKQQVMINFYEISYGSLKESKYLLDFSFKENYIDEDGYDKTLKMAEEIGAMLWSTLQKISHNK
jgi:four helix bundle protein